MKLLEVPFDTPISFEYLGNKLIARVIGKCIAASTNTPFCCLGFKTSEIHSLIENFPLINQTRDRWFEDSHLYHSTKLYASIDVIRKTFDATTWLAGYHECEFVKHYPNQKCLFCSIPAPHTDPNFDEQYICQICCVNETL